MDPNDTQAPGTDAPAQADTADTQVSEASEVKQEAPEATQNEQGTQTEVTATDTAESKLYAGKYKTAEEMEKAYVNLQSKATRDAMEKADLSRTLNQAFSTPEITDTGDSFSDETDPRNQDIENLKRTTSVQSFIMTHPDANGAAMNEVLNKDPYVKQMPSYEAKLQYAYALSQNMSQPQAIAEARKEAAQATQVKVAEKQAAQVEAARATQPTDEGAELFERATGNYDQATRDKARLGVIKKRLINL